MTTHYEGEADDARISTVNTTNQSYPALVWRKFRRSVPGNRAFGPPPPSCARPAPIPRLTEITRNRSLLPTSSC